MADLVFEIGLGLTVTGLLVAFAAIILKIISGRKSENRVRGAGILFIGPIPIIFGTDRESAKVVMLLAIALIAMITILMILPYWLR